VANLRVSECVDAFAVWYYGGESGFAYEGSAGAVVHGFSFCAEWVLCHLNRAFEGWRADERVGIDSGKLRGVVVEARYWIDVHGPTRSVLVFQTILDCAAHDDRSYHVYEAATASLYHGRCVSIAGCDEAHALNNREDNFRFFRRGMRVEVDVDGEREMSVRGKSSASIEFDGTEDEMLFVERVDIALRRVSRFEDQILLLNMAHAHAPCLHRSHIRCRLAPPYRVGMCPNRLVLLTQKRIGVELVRVQSRLVVILHPRSRDWVMTANRYLRKNTVLLYRREDVIGRYLVGNGRAVVA